MSEFIKRLVNLWLVYKNSNLQKRTGKEGFHFTEYEVKAVNCEEVNIWATMDR